MGRLRRVRQAYAWGLLGLQAGCFMPLSSGQALQGEVVALREDIQSTRRELQIVRATESEHQQQSLSKLQELSSALREFNQNARSSNADFGSQMERMIQDVQELRGTVEVNEHRLGESTQSLAERLDKLAQKNPRPAEADAKLPADKKEALAYGQKLSKAGKTAESRAVYRALLKQYPRLPGTTDEAAFRLGETFLAEGQYDDALREYVRIVEKFGGGSRVDDAYYKIGICSLALGRLDDAQTFFSEIVSNRRKSPFYKNAKAKLDEVLRRQSKKPADGAPKPGELGH
jgi:TolA-binding protein